MDSDAFVEVVSEQRSTRTHASTDGHGNVIAKKLKHKPYIKCPRCSNWKLAAHVHKERESKGFSKTTTEWQFVNRWWECDECAATFDVTSTEE